MRNEHTDGAAIDRAAKRTHEVIERCHERASDAHLRHDDGRQYRPQRQGKLQKLREREGHKRGDRHPDGKRELHTVPAQQSGNLGQKSCDALHDTVSSRRYRHQSACGCPVTQKTWNKITSATLLSTSTRLYLPFLMHVWHLPGTLRGSVNCRCRSLKHTKLQAFDESR